MEFGVGYFPTHDGLRPGEIARGRFVNFDRIWSWPKPAQNPRPPILAGGGGPTAEKWERAIGDLVGR